MCFTVLLTCMFVFLLPSQCTLAGHQHGDDTAEGGEHSTAGATASKSFSVLFKDEEGHVVGEEDYSAGSKIFKTSEFLKTSIKNYELFKHGKRDRLQLDVKSEPRTFGMLVQMLEKQSLDSEASASDIFDMLYLAEYLMFDTAETMTFCEALVGATTTDTMHSEAFRREIKLCKDIPICKVYLLLLLKTKIIPFSVYLDESGNEAVFGGDCYRHHGKTLKDIEVFNKVNISNYVLNGFYSDEKNELDWIACILDMMEVKEMKVQNDFLYKYAFEFIAKIKSLERLRIEFIEIREKGCFECIQKLENLRELYIDIYVDREYYDPTDHDVLLEKHVIPEIGGIVSLEKLCIVCDSSLEGRLEGLEKLKNLRELRLDVHELSEHDIQEIGGIVSLEKLSIECDSELGRLNGLEELKNLRELRLDVHELSENDIQEIGSVVNLEKLSIRCDSGLERLNGLEKLKNLRELKLDVNSYSYRSRGLGKDAILDIALVESLEKLEIECYEQPEVFEDLVKRKKLREVAITCRAKQSRRDAIEEEYHIYDREW